MTASLRTHPHPSPFDLLPPRGDPARGWALTALFLGPLVCGAAALLLGADASWDLRNYHWYNAYAYLNGRRDMDFMSSQAQFFLNPWLDVPFYLLATHVPLKIASFILGTVQGLNFPLLFLIAYRTLVLEMTGRKVAAAAALAAAGVFSAMGISELGTVFYDNVTSLGVLLSLLLLLGRPDWLRETDLRRAALYVSLAGLPAGLMAGLKLTCVSYSVGLCLALLAHSRDVRRCLLLSLCFGLGVTAGYLVTYAHWGWYLFATTGNPLFPFFNVIFHSPLLAPDNMWLDFAPPHGWRLLVFPFLFGADPYLVNEIAWHDWRIPAVYGLMLFLLVYYRILKRPACPGAITESGAARFLLLTSGVSYGIWLSSETVYRYLLTLDMLAPLLLVVCIGLLPLARPARIVAAIAVVTALSLTIEPGNWGRHRAWPDIMVKADLPALADPAHTMVLMAGLDAYAYLVPAFPPGVAFVRIQSRGIDPETDTGIIRVIRQKIEAHEGPLLMFIPGRELMDAAAVAKEFHLTLHRDRCRLAFDMLSEARLDRPEDRGNAYPRSYNLCTVTKNP